MLSPPAVALPLFGYQLAWMADTSRLKIYLKSRQVGITFAETLDLVQRCIAVKQRWYYLSISEARAAEAIEYVRLHCLAIGVGVKVDRGWVEVEKVRFAKTTVTFPNGSQIVGLPANARTARGCSGNLVLDEFGWHIDAKAIWTAAHAIAMWGYHVHVISTPNGQQGEFFRIWSNDRQHDPEAIESGLRAGLSVCADHWSRHLTDIYDASKDGHPVDIARQRELAGNDEVWRQEYCCAFLDEAMAWIPYKLMTAATTNAATLHIDSRQPLSGDAYLGCDIGRKRDLTVIWINEGLGETTRTRGVLALDRAPFNVQRQALWDAMESVRRGHIDRTGIGEQLAEETVEKFGEGRCAGIHFSGNRPAALASQVRSRLEKKDWELPDCEHIRRDFHAIRRTYTEHGKQTFDAARGKDGHADRFWAAALALDAQRQAWDGIKAGDIVTTGEAPRYDAVDAGRSSGWGSY